MIPKLLIGLAIVLLILVIVIATRPADFRIQRSAVIQAPAASVFPHVNDLHRWKAWSPWEKKDPNSKSSYEGPPSGPGSSMTWAGNNDVGEGTMTITGSIPSENVTLRLDFRKPFQATNTAEFTFSEVDGKTTVTWAMTGKNNFMGKAFSMLIDCDKMVGGEFETGLASLKAIAETPDQPSTAGLPKQP